MSVLEHGFDLKHVTLYTMRLKSSVFPPAPPLL